jgi:hypothetical protein
MLSGHLQLSISLKNRDEIKQAVGILESILVEDNISKIKDELKSGTVIISDSKQIKSKPWMHELPSAAGNPLTITKQMIRDRTGLKNKESVSAVLAEVKKNESDRKKGLKNIQQVLTASQIKQRTAALKRKRDSKTGHFLPGKVSK